MRIAGKTGLAVAGLLMSISNSAVTADEELAVCGLDVEGVDLAMPKEAVAKTWAAIGFDKTLDSDERKSKAPVRGMNPSLKFAAPGFTPAENFLYDLNWTQQLSTGVTLITGRYVLPKGGEKKAAYDEFLSTTITDYCKAALPKLRAEAPPPQPTRSSRSTSAGRGAVDRGQLDVCEKVVQGTIPTTAGGYISIPGAGFRYESNDGCVLSYQTAGIRNHEMAFVMTIQSPRTEN